MLFTLSNKIDELLKNPVYKSPNDCWKILRNRYPTKGRYQAREVIPHYHLDKIWLHEWLVSKGFDVSFNEGHHEEIRFKKNHLLGIIYCSGSGNLLAHDVCELYKKEESDLYPDLSKKVLLELNNGEHYIAKLVELNGVGKSWVEFNTNVFISKINFLERWKYL